MDLYGVSGITAVFSDANLSLDDGATTFDNDAFDYAIDGIMYTEPAGTNETSPTTDHYGNAFTALSTDQTCWFLWCINAAGTISVVQGPVEDVDGTNDVVYDGKYPELPEVPEDVAPFGLTRMQSAGTSSAWTFGASNWNATGMTDVVVSLATMPSRPPQTAAA